MLDNIAGYFLAGVAGFVIAGAAVWHYKDLEIAAQRAQSQQQIIALTNAQNKVGQKAAEQQIQVQHDVVTKYQTIREEIPTYIHVHDPVADPYLPSGFVILHNAAASASPVPAPPTGFDDPAGGAQASELLSTVVTNYQTCTATAEELVGLQNWVRDISSQKVKK